MIKFYNKRLSKEHQKRLGIEFKSYIAYVNYDDFKCNKFEYEFDVDTLTQEHLDIIKKDAFKLLNSSDYYYINVVVNYKIIDDIMRYFDINTGSMYMNNFTDENNKNYIESNHCHIKLMNNSKPQKIMIYEEIYDCINNIEDVNGNFHKDVIDECIEKLNMLKRVI